MAMVPHGRADATSGAGAGGIDPTAPDNAPHTDPTPLWGRPTRTPRTVGYPEPSVLLVRLGVRQGAIAAAAYCEHVTGCSGLLEQIDRIFPDPLATEREGGERS